ncbi:MAG: hypothetical protein EZS28_016301 [Streblomastix strix]|uniref:Uncharacterized protein n=1 Tax=Streblomastix strix TaxID=222440 RepID=A0A5J4W021_9EUKA|nr:MAG: hypothetical protein EZS28_016301 [Streblomastix strix]
MINQLKNQLEHLNNSLKLLKPSINVLYPGVQDQIKSFEEEKTIPSTPQAQLKQTPVPTPKPKQTLLQVTRFERRSSSSAHGVKGSRGLEWGKRW